MNKTPLLEGAKIEKSYDKGRVPVLRGLSFSLFPGEILGVVGESGCGKSTLLRLIAGLDAPDKGTLWWKGVPLLPGKKRDWNARRAIQLVFQDALSSFDPKRTVGASILDALRFLRPELRGEDRKRELSRLLERVGLPEELAGRRPGELSGGQCQRAAAARALAPKPQILLCDEVTSSLDALAQANLIELLESCRQREGLSILFVCHDLDLADVFCNRCLHVPRCA